MTAATATPAAEAARQLYRESVAAEMPLTGRQLAAQFDRSESWGRARIREVRSADAVALPVAPAAAELPHSVNSEVTESETAAPSGPTSATAAPVAPVAGRQPRGSRAVVMTAFLLGIVASVAANIAHADDAAGPRLAAAFAPVALLLAVECMSRPAWYRSGPLWALARYGGTGLVALVAAVMSYRHMHGLLLSYGEDSLSAAIGPLAVDGLMITSGFALLAMTPSAVRGESTPSDREG